MNHYRTVAHKLYRPILGGFLLLLLITSAQVPETYSQTQQWEHRWVQIGANFFIDGEVERVKGIMDRAKAAGYTGIVLAEVKTLFWWTFDDPAFWRNRVQEVKQHADALGLDFYNNVFDTGRCGGMLSHDPSLANGYPMVDMPLVAQNGRLVPQQNAQIADGSFENFSGNELNNWFHDEPGVLSFRDTSVVKHGNSSIRFENFQSTQDASGRLFQDFNVVPFQQYRVRVWVKMENLNANLIQLLVRGYEDDRELQTQWPTYVDEFGDRIHFQFAQDMTMDWAELSFTFNSSTYDHIYIGFGLWGAESGKIWWDDLRLDTVPTHNIIRRDDLPFSIRAVNGTTYTEGTDFEPVSDPLLGQIPFQGAFDTYHAPPEILLTPGSNIVNGEQVFLSGYHALVITNGEMGCSWSHEDYFSLAHRVIQEAEQNFPSDGYFLGHNEQRSGGWEPGDVGPFNSSGEAFAAHISRTIAIVGEESGGKEMFIWSDIFDPFHNAVPNYYHINNTMEGVWEGVPPEVTIVNWAGGETFDNDGSDFGRQSLEFFEERGHKQILAGYYDYDVVTNYQSWMADSAGIDNITGVMYTTWIDNFDDLELFAEVWWGSEPPPPAAEFDVYLPIMRK
ncbi:MAG: carbohydrate binding domain-containing protein [Chloroflexota bacterium]